MATTSRRLSDLRHFAYTRDQAKAVLTALKQAGLKEGIDQKVILRRITKMARQVLQDQLARPPAAGPVRKQLQALMTAIKHLKSATIALNGHTKSLIWEDLIFGGHPACRRLLEEWDMLHCTGLLGPVREMSSDYSSKSLSFSLSGTLPDKAAAATALPTPLSATSACLYRDASGKMPTRQHSPVQARDTGPFHHLVKTAIDPTGLLSPKSSYLDDVGRYTVLRFNPDRARRRPHR